MYWPTNALLQHIPVGTAGFPMAADYFAKKQKKAMQINKKLFKFLFHNIGCMRLETCKQDYVS